jgi:hypothetical protein
MRFFAGLLAYFVGVSALVSIAVVGLMALQSGVDRTPAAPVALAASNNERLVGQAKAALATQKKTQPDRIHQPLLCLIALYRKVAKPHLGQKRKLSER